MEGGKISCPSLITFLCALYPMPSIPCSKWLLIGITLLPLQEILRARYDFRKRDLGAFTLPSGFCRAAQWFCSMQSSLAPWLGQQSRKLAGRCALLPGCAALCCADGLGGIHGGDGITIPVVGAVFCLAAFQPEAAGLIFFFFCYVLYHVLRGEVLSEQFTAPLWFLLPALCLA